MMSSPQDLLSFPELTTIFLGKPEQSICGLRKEEEGEMAEGDDKALPGHCPRSWPREYEVYPGGGDLVYLLGAPVQRKHAYGWWHVSGKLHP